MDKGRKYPPVVWLKFGLVWLFAALVVSLIIGIDLQITAEAGDSGKVEILETTTLFQPFDYGLLAAWAVRFALVAVVVKLAEMWTRAVARHYRDRAETKSAFE